MCGRIWGHSPKMILRARHPSYIYSIYSVAYLVNYVLVLCASQCDASRAPLYAQSLLSPTFLVLFRYRPVYLHKPHFNNNLFGYFSNVLNAHSNFFLRISIF